MILYTVRAFWGNREETADACVVRLHDLLQRLVDIDELFSHWYVYLSRRKRYEVFPDITRLATCFDRIHNDVGGIFEELGYMGVLGTGTTGDCISLSLSCGMNSRVELLNSAISFFYIVTPERKRLLQKDTMVRIVEAIVRSWEPAWCNVEPYSIIPPPWGRSFSVPDMGWMLYLSDAMGSVPSINGIHEQRTISDCGTLLITTEEAYDENAEVNDGAVEALHRALAGAGLLKPIK